MPKQGTNEQASAPAADPATAAAQAVAKLRR